jgi:menaquinone-dependent protoporphyrinogen oxidase
VLNLDGIHNLLGGVMNNILIVYASHYGQTQKIAEKIGNEMRSKNIQAVSVSVDEASHISLESFDGVIVGTPVYAGKTNKKLQKWVIQNRELLSRKITGLFVVALNSADKRATARIVDSGLLRDFMVKTQWIPKFAANFAGALNYLEYNLFIKFIMKRISRSAGGPTDSSRDYELTDWQVVTDFTNVFSENKRGMRFDVSEELKSTFGQRKLRQSPVKAQLRSNQEIPW